eukprot:CAMPEP_0172425202 /NCGR_PEP_ID=MMETSP1064-20121228/30858_1 /TAXON_ID=202472 /ORGANISM="Aulacoseira subarctica , Strain CCAP 1002/5" /LENGTH=228 /DNA_ID=CAMNT_0013167899 /DNA_START=53 /DNA_END=739 /DNA_ORIENTATION=+
MLRIASNKANYLCCAKSSSNRISANFVIIFTGSRQILNSVEKSAKNSRCERKYFTTQADKKQVEEDNGVFYEGALAAATLHLKRVSITTCAIGIFGLPLMAVLCGASIPAMGQLAVGGTAIFATAGSTAALSYCVSPYVHTLEKVASSSGEDEKLIKAVTRNIFAWKVETVFNPENDVIHYSGSRPFCNFFAKGLPMYVHPELIEDDILRAQLVGKVAAARVAVKKEE